jgi:hypothetical protein
VFETRRLDLCQVPARLVRFRALAVRRRHLRRVQLLLLMSLGYPPVNEGWRLNVQPELVKRVEPVWPGEQRR